MSYQDDRVLALQFAIDTFPASTFWNTEVITERAERFYSFLMQDLENDKVACATDKLDDSDKEWDFFEGTTELITSSPSVIDIINAVVDLFNAAK